MAAPVSVPPPKVLDRSKVEPTAERIDSWNQKIRDAAPHIAATELFKNEIKWVHAKFDKCGTRAFPAAFTSDGHPLVKIDPDSWGPRALEIVMPPAQVAWASTEPKRQVGTKKDGGGINPDATPQFCIKFMQTEDKRYKEELNAEFRRVGLMLEKLINIDRCT